MKKVIVVATVLWAVSLAVVMAQPVVQSASGIIREGLDYARLPKELPGGGNKIEVIEFFSYACPHCSSFAPVMTEWEKRMPENVRLTLIPVSFRPSWELLAKAYYAGELLGITQKTHHGFFKAIHEDHKEINSAEQIADIYVSMGIDRKKFLAAMNSFAVETSLRSNAQLSAKYAISGVPAVAVNGRYITSGSMVGDYSRLLEVVDYLVAQEARRLNISLRNTTVKKPIKKPIKPGKPEKPKQ